MVPFALKAEWINSQLLFPIFCGSKEKCSPQNNDDKPVMKKPNFGLEIRKGDTKWRQRQQIHLFSIIYFIKETLRLFYKKYFYSSMDLPWRHAVWFAKPGEYSF